MKRVLRSLALVAIAVASLNAAKAQNPHFVAGTFSFTEGTSTVTASGRIAGIGNYTKTGLQSVRLEQDYDITFNCVNPGGQKPTPWQNVSGLAEASVDVPIDANGSVAFNLTADIEPVINYNKPQWQAKFCPSKKWNIQILTWKRNGDPRVYFNYTQVIGSY